MPNWETIEVHLLNMERGLQEDFAGIAAINPPSPPCEKGESYLRISSKS